MKREIRPEWQCWKRVRSQILQWVGALLLLWSSATAAHAGALADRVTAFPEWQGKPPVQAAVGDLVYPDWFAGNWNVSSTLIDLAAPLAPEIVSPGFESNRQYLQQPIHFPVRFGVDASQAKRSRFPTPQPAPSTSIVADRAFNGLNIAKAYLGDRAVLAVKVDPANPNRQITRLQGDRQLVSIVAERAIETPTSDQFITTEVFQQQFRNNSQLYFNKVETTTAYQHSSTAHSDEPAIVADQITAVYLSPQDPDYFKASRLGDARPVALYRYRLEFIAHPVD